MDRRGHGALSTPSPPLAIESHRSPATLKTRTSARDEAPWGETASGSPACLAMSFTMRKSC